ncbi:hypothetical protein CAPTEDRAFT_197891 [Capitella teleta]|uniref:Uncharacterized protein n=1 Tax=Capitella teleta TaxID=283909 RepID=R7U552_CAPTE|nr:hypothetical protein CAPTEDRAFT_197891 [Capitella teleta]|eukprot:ELU01480.1 hypothetical protein CAPTEDRAFT_197891 [Capitella teleta]
MSSLYDVSVCIGGSNRDNPSKYGCSLKEMVGEWRTKWFEETNEQTAEKFAFGQVQIANSEPDIEDVVNYPDVRTMIATPAQSDSPLEDMDSFRKQWGRPTPGSCLYSLHLAPGNKGENERDIHLVRWYQTHEYGYTPNDDLNNIFTAVAMDLPSYQKTTVSPYTLHLRQVAERLSLGAYQVAYGDQSEGRFKGFPYTISRMDSILAIEYDLGTLDVRTTDTDNFELCCAADQGTICGENDWTTTSILSSDGNFVLLLIPCSNHVTGLRYSWHDYPCDFEFCPIYSSENSLPAPAFVLNEHFPNRATIDV